MTDRTTSLGLLASSPPLALDLGAEPPLQRQRQLQQFFTPAWVAERLVQRHFPELSPADTVLEPACGDGRFLMAIAPEVDAYGVEIDPATAQAARNNSGREVLQGDFCSVDLPRRPTVILGNPPFDGALFDAMLARCYELLEYDQRAGFLLPVYTFQTASRVMGYNARWSLAQELLPRNIFEGLSCPIMWATFTKARKTALSGFFLYAEMDALADLKSDARRLVVGNQSRASGWREVVLMAILACGGQASLPQIYAAIEQRRPSATPWWREQVRKVAARHFMRVGAGVYSAQPLGEPAACA